MVDTATLIQRATNLVELAIELLNEAEAYPALPYLREGFAVLQAEEDGAGDRDNDEAMTLLRQARVLLDRKGELQAACGVDDALMRLGEPFPVLSAFEVNARMNYWDSRAGARNAAGAG